MTEPTFSRQLARSGSARGGHFPANHPVWQRQRGPIPGNLPLLAITRGGRFSPHHPLWSPEFPKKLVQKALFPTSRPPAADHRPVVLYDYATLLLILAPYSIRRSQSIFHCTRTAAPASSSSLHHSRGLKPIATPSPSILAGTQTFISNAVWPVWPAVFQKKEQEKCLVILHLTVIPAVWRC